MSTPRTDPTTPLELLGSHPGLNVVDPGTILTRLWYFDGKFLRAAGFRLDQEYYRSLVALSNQASGSGVVHGFDVAGASGDRVRIEGGLALAPSGRVIYLPQRVELSIAELITRSTGTFDPSAPPEPGSAEFRRCPPDQPAGPEITVPERPLYVLTVAGIEALCGEEERFGQLCEDACATETDRSKVVEGVCFRVRELTLTLPTSTAVPFGAEHLRSRVASAYFELERRAIPSMISGAGLRNPVWCTAAQGIGGEEVPLAVLDRAGAVTSFIDTWTARRELMETTPRRYWSWRMAMRPWDAFLAQVLQFQCQLLDLGTGGAGGGIVDPCGGERDVLVAAQEVLTGTEGFLPPEVFTRVEAVRAKITAVLGSGQRPASGSVLVDGGIMEVPAAGYLPTSLERDVAEQVRALFGPGADLRFCVVRPDFVPEALLEAQHMERISLTRGLDNPKSLEEVDVLVPGGEIVKEPATPVRAFVGDGRVLPRLLGTRTGSALSLSVVGRDSTAVGWSWTLAGYGEAPRQQSVPALLDALISAAHRAFSESAIEAEAPTEITIRPDSEHDQRRFDASFTQRLLREGGNATLRKARLLAQTSPFGGPPSARIEPDRPLADGEDRPVAVWLDMETAAALDTLPLNGSTEVRLRACLYSRATTNPQLLDVRLNGTLRVADIPDVSSSHKVIKTRLDGVADAFRNGQSGLLRIRDFPLNWVIDVPPAGIRRLSVVAGEPARASAVFFDTGDPRHITGQLLLVTTNANPVFVTPGWEPAAVSPIPGVLARAFQPDIALDIEECSGALAPGSAGRSLADSVISIISAELAAPGRDPAFAAYATQRLLADVSGETVRKVHATMDWVLFHRRRTRTCVDDTVERPLRTRIYRLYHAVPADDLRRFEALRARDDAPADEAARVTVNGLGFEPVAMLEFLEGQVELRTPRSVLRASWQAGDRGNRLELALVGDLGPGDGETVALGRLATVRSLLADLVDSSQAQVAYLPDVPLEFQEPGLDGVMLTVGVHDVVNLGCIQVIEIIARLSQSQEADLAEAFFAGDVARVDRFVGTGVGVLGTTTVTNSGPDGATFNKRVAQVANIVATRILLDGTVLWLDEDWPGLGGDADRLVQAAATQLLDAAKVPVGVRRPPQILNFSGSPCPARLFVVSRPKQVLGCLQVIHLISGLELTPEAHLREAFDQRDIAQVDQLIADGVGVLGSVTFTPEGPDPTTMDQLVQQVATIVATKILAPGTVLWVDTDWSGRGGEGETVARAAATQLLDTAKVPADKRQDPVVVDFSGSPCPTRLFVRSGS